MSEFAYKTSSQQNSNPHISREYRACAVCETYEDGRTREPLTSSMEGLAHARLNYTDSAAAVGPPVGLAQARPNNTAAYYSDTRKALHKHYLQ